MKRDSVPAVVLLAVLVGLLGLGLMLAPPSTQSGAAGHAQLPYQIADERTLTGIITGVPRVGRTASVVVTLRTTRQSFDLVLAPASYLADAKLALMKGDRIQVVAAKGLVHDEGVEDVLLVREITNGTRSVTLRDPCGAPAWEPGRVSANAR